VDKPSFGDFTVVSAGCALSDVVRGVPIAVCESKRLELGIARSEGEPPARISLPVIDGRSKDILLRVAALCVLHLGLCCRGVKPRFA
jgi:hypothetical protein